MKAIRTWADHRPRIHRMPCRRSWLRRSREVHPSSSPYGHLGSVWRIGKKKQTGTAIDLSRMEPKGFELLHFAYQGLWSQAWIGVQRKRYRKL